MAPVTCPRPLPDKRPWWAELAAKPFVAWPHTIDIVGLFSLALSIGSLLFGAWKINAPSFVSTSTTGTHVLTCVGKWKVGLLLFWALIPPAWFWLQFFALYLYDDPKKREYWDRFKYGQDIASKIWLALVSALTILYFGKDLKP